MCRAAHRHKLGGFLTNQFLMSFSVHCARISSSEH